EDHVLLPLQRVPEHRPQRVLVFDDENLRGQRSQPGGTPARRASSSMSAICAGWAGSSRLVKSADRPLMRLCSASLNVSLRRTSSFAAVMRARQYFSSFAGSASLAVSPFGAAGFTPSSTLVGSCLAPASGFIGGSFFRSSLVYVLAAGGEALRRSASFFARSPRDWAQTGTAAVSSAPA